MSIEFTSSHSAKRNPLPETRERAFGDKSVVFKFVTAGLPEECWLPDIGRMPFMPPDDVARVVAHLQSAQSHFVDNHSNVVAMFPGYPRRLDDDYQWDTRVHWLVYVHHAGFTPLHEQPIADEYEGIPTRVYEGRYWRGMDRDHSARFNVKYSDVVAAGESIGPVNDRTSGTLGAFLVSEKTKKIYFLTSHHLVEVVRNDPKRILISAPSLESFVRNKRVSLRISKERLKADSEDGFESKIAEIDRQREQLSRPDYRRTAEEEKQHVIGEVHLGASRHASHITKIDNEDVEIGIDVALCEWRNETGRLILSTIIEIAGSETYNKYEVSSDIAKFNYTTCLSEDDVVVKLGRSSGLTSGFPSATTGVVTDRDVGDFTVLEDPSLDRPAGHRYFTSLQWKSRRKKGKTVIMLNQYLISHKYQRDFAEDGDSGSMCYLNSPKWAESDRLKLKPWAMLNGGLVMPYYTAGIASSMEAVMNSFGSYNLGLLHVISEQNQKLLGTHRARAL